MGFLPQLDLALLLTTISCGPDRTLAPLHVTQTGLKAREVASTTPRPQHPKLLPCPSQGSPASVAPQVAMPPQGVALQL